MELATGILDQHNFPKHLPSTILPHVVVCKGITNPSVAREGHNGLTNTTLSPGELCRERHS